MVVAIKKAPVLSQDHRLWLNFQALSARDDSIGNTIKCVIQNLSNVSRERLSTEHEQ